MDTISELSSESNAGSPPSTGDHSAKRSATDAGFKNGNRPVKSVKRRASKACQCCRARKVRCNVVEHGAPCTNCRLDQVECVVSESKRKKKWTGEAKPGVSNGETTSMPMSAQPPYDQPKRSEEHVPHALYQDAKENSNILSKAQAQQSLYNAQILLNLQKLGLSNLSGIPLPAQIPPPSLPKYVKALPARLGTDDIIYLQKKGALAIPETSLRNELLKNYAQFVHPYMPMIDIQDFLQAVDRNDGEHTVSLLLFQAVMFAGIATIELSFLKSAGYGSRREARRDFFQKTRLLYDFDIEMDRISLIQSLLLMTYWYETPDDQKDSHHWMGIAVALSHTIGLHRDQRSQSLDSKRQKQWRRIWWCTYMRDRLIALGMRRPTKISSGDFDVPMLTMDDFEFRALAENISCIAPDCTVMRSVERQQELAIMCIEKAKLCVCISNVLSVQYSVLHNNHGVMNAEGPTKTTMMLVAKKLEPREDEVTECDKELRAWKDNLPVQAEYMPSTWNDVDSGNESMVLHRSLLHMIYYATVSALHRPQVLPSGATAPRNIQPEFMEISRKAVRHAAGEITTIATNLSNLDLVRLLPTPGITVLLPAIIIHLLDIKSPDEATRRTSLSGFCQCMQILGKLRDIYAAADYSTAFLEAAIRKAEIVLPQQENQLKDPRNVITSAQGLIEASKRLNLPVTNVASTRPRDAHLTPPPDDSVNGNLTNGMAMTNDEIARKLNSFFASTPPSSDHHASDNSIGDPTDAAFEALQMDSGAAMFLDGAIAIPGNDFMAAEPDFEGLINLDAAGEIFSIDDDAFGAMQGESSGFTMDVDWMRGMQTSDGLSPAPVV